MINMPNRGLNNNLCYSLEFLYPKLTKLYFIKSLSSPVVMDKQ